LTARPRGRYVVITVCGELDLATGPTLRANLISVLDRQASRDVILDVTGVEFADAQGLSALLAVKTGVLLRGGSLRLAGPAAQLVRVLTITGLDRQFAIYPTVEAASGLDAAPLHHSPFAGIAGRPAPHGR
jgi:anti-sigma B factor antagonist